MKCVEKLEEKNYWRLFRVAKYISKYHNIKGLTLTIIFLYTLLFNFRPAETSKLIIYSYFFTGRPLSYFSVPVPHFESFKPVIYV